MLGSDKLYKADVDKGQLDGTEGERIMSGLQNWTDCCVVALNACKLSVNSIIYNTSQ